MSECRVGCHRPTGNQIPFQEVPFDRLVCAEVDVEWMGPLLPWSPDPVWVSTGSAIGDRRESVLRMFYSASGRFPVSLTASVRISVDSRGFTAETFNRVEMSQTYLAVTQLNS